MARKVGKTKRIVMLDHKGFLGVPPDTPIKFLMTAETLDFLERSAAAMAIDRGQLLMNIIIDEYLNPESAVLLRTTEGVIGDRHLTVELVSHNRAHNSWPDVRTFSVTQKGELPPGKLELLIVTVRGKQRAVPHSRELLRGTKYEEEQR
jgi:hypothetical protein